MVFLAIQTDIFAGTIVSGYKHAFAPHHEGIYDVLNSTTASGSTETVGVDDTPPPVKRIVLLGSRRETSDEDMRRIALAKLLDLVMGDPAATRLGLSLQHILNSGGMSHVIEQSFSDCFRAKASSTLQKRANSLWKLSLTLAELGSLHPLRFSEEQLYNALCLMREKELGATSGQHVIEALHFLDSTAGFTMCMVLLFLGAVVGWLEICSSPRIHLARNVLYLYDRWNGWNNLCQISALRSDASSVNCYSAFIRVAVGRMHNV